VLETSVEMHAAEEVKRVVLRKPAELTNTAPFKGMLYLPYHETVEVLREPEPDEEGLYEIPD
jgi:hypothetical protein